MSGLNSIDPVELTKSLIACPSVTPVDAGVLDLLQKQLEEIGFECNRYKFSDKDTPDVDNLFAKYGKGSPHLCFGGHTDVVPVGDLKSWSSDPFSPIIKNGKMYGRGASDMKSAIAAFVSAANSFIESKDFNGTISLLITDDEEGPAINGTKKVLKEIYKNGEKIDSCIVGEPTCPNRLGEVIKIGRRGSLTTKLTIHGQQGHVAYPQWTLNPVSVLIKILKILDSNEFDKGNELFPPSNLEVVKISVDNEADNVVPRTASAKINIRYNTIQSQEILQEYINETVNSELKDSNYTSEIIFYNTASPFLTKESNFTDKIKDSVNEVTGENPIFSTSGGTSDARFYKDYCEVAEFGLIGETAHQVNEHVLVSDIEKLTKIYEKLIISYFS
jgi:succinyl-diaminopimelate desuccinylase